MHIKSSPRPSYSSGHKAATKRGILKARSTPAFLPETSSFSQEYCEVPYIPNPYSRSHGQVETGYTFNPLKSHPKESKIRFSPEPAKLKRSKSARTPSPSIWNEDKSNLSRSPKRSSFMKIMKRAKGSIKSPGSGRATSPTSSQRSPSINRSPSLTRSPSSNSDISMYQLSPDLVDQRSMRREPSREQNLIRIWADQVDGGVVGYKGFLISPDTTARELLTTVHSKLGLPGTDKDFFICANFFHSSISDRPLMDTDRPLCLHEDWDEQENYRFELRQKPKASILVFGDDQMRFSRTPFLRGMVEISEDATTARLITELVNKYSLDPCQRYHLIEKRPNFDRVMKSTDNPVLLQKRWLSHEEIKFVLTAAPNTPDLFTQLVTPSQLSSTLQTTTTDNTSFTSVTPYQNSSFESHKPVIQRSSFAPSATSLASSCVMEGTEDCTVPDFASADLTFNQISPTERCKDINFIIDTASDNFNEHIMNIGIPQQKINRGFEEMQIRWLGYQDPTDHPEDNSTNHHSQGLSRSSSEELLSIEEYLFADLNRLPETEPDSLQLTSFEYSEFLDSSYNPIRETSEYLTSTPREINTTIDQPSAISNCSYEAAPLNQTGESCKMSFGTSNESEDDDSEPELFIGAKNTSDQPSCSDSGVNVSDVSSYRPADQEKSFIKRGEKNRLLDLPAVKVISPIESSRLSSGDEDLGQVPSEVTTPRNLSTNSYLWTEMSWDNFEIARANFESDEEYHQYLKHLKVQSEIKNRTGNFIEQLSDIAAMSESEFDLTRDNSLDESLTASEHSYNETMIACPQSEVTTEHSLVSETLTHREASDKDNVYNTSASLADTVTTKNSMTNNNTMNISSGGSSGSLELTESLALLEETKKLYDVLEEKTSLLEEKYFSPERMKFALSDPLSRSYETTSNLPKSALYPDNRDTSMTDNMSIQSSLISKSIEVLEQLSQSSAEQADLYKPQRHSPLTTKCWFADSQQEVTSSPKGTFETQKAVHNNDIHSMLDKSESEDTGKGPLTSLKICSHDDSNEIVALTPGFRSNIEDVKKPKTERSEKKQMRSDFVKPLDVIKFKTPQVKKENLTGTKKISDITTPSQYSLGTSISRSTANTESTTILKESVERLRFEIEDVLLDCNESFTTSLDTDRHNFSDSTYNGKQSQLSNSLENRTIVSDEDLYGSENESNASNPVILDNYCSDRENEIDEIFENFLGDTSDNIVSVRDESSTVDVRLTYNSDKLDATEIHYVECDVSETSGSVYYPDPASMEEIKDLNSILIVSRDMSTDTESLGFPPHELEVPLPWANFKNTEELNIEEKNNQTENCIPGKDISLDEHSLSALNDKHIPYPGNLYKAYEDNSETSQDFPNYQSKTDAKDFITSIQNATHSLVNGSNIKQEESMKLQNNVNKLKQEHVPGCKADICQESYNAIRSCSRHTEYENQLELCNNNKDANEEVPATINITNESLPAVKNELSFETPSEKSMAPETLAALSGTILDQVNESKSPSHDLELSITSVTPSVTPAVSPKPPIRDSSYGAAYDEISDSTDSETDSERSSETLSANYKDLCSRLNNLKSCFKRDKYGKILDLEKDEETGLSVYEIKLPCIWEEESNGDISSRRQISQMMPNVDLKRQYKNLLAEIEETKPKLRQLEVLQTELTTMQKAYHDLKEQALRMSIEQDAQKNQIDEEIRKLKISNQDLIKKNKGSSKEEAVVKTIMELEKLYSDRILALEKALKQKDNMVTDLEHQNRNMMTQLNVTRRQSVQLETANELLHKRNEVLVVEKQDGEINPAQFFNSDNERLALLAKQCDALQQTVSSLESTLMLRVKELNETYEDLDTMRSDLRVAEVARIEAEAQLDVNKREVGRLQNVNEELAEEIKDKIAENGKLEQDNKHLHENLESLQLQYDDCKDRVSRLENALLSQEKALETIKASEKSAKGELTELEKKLEVASQNQRKKDDEMRKLRKEVEKAKKGSSMYNLCTAIKPGETLELISVDLPAITDQIPRGLYIKQGPHGVYIDKIDSNSSAGKLHRLNHGDRIVEINLNDVSNATFETVKKDVDSPRAMQLVVARVAPDIRNESKLRAEALKDQIKGLVIDLDKTARHCQNLQVESADLKDEIANLKAKQKSELSSTANQKTQDEIQNLKALLAQKEQYLKTLETTVRSKNELLVTLEMDSHRSPRATPNSSINQHNSFSPGLSSTSNKLESGDRKRDANSSKDDSISELVNRYG